MIEKIEFLIASPYKKGVDVMASDLPKELTSLRVQLKKSEE